MNFATQPKPPIIDADFDEAIRGLLTVKPPPSGKKAKVAQQKHAKKSRS
jgi:hypothetical protein